MSLEYLHLEDADPALWQWVAANSTLALSSGCSRVRWARHFLSSVIGWPSLNPAMKITAGYLACESDAWIMDSVGNCTHAQIQVNCTEDLRVLSKWLEYSLRELHTSLKNIFQSSLDLFKGKITGNPHI